MKNTPHAACYFQRLYRTVLVPMGFAGALLLSASGSHALEIIKDNSDATGITITGTWTTSTARPGYYGTNFIHDGNTAKGAKSVRYTPDIPATGRYNVYVRWTSDPNRASNVPIDVVSASGTDLVQVDQRSGGGTWFLLGAYVFTAGTSGSVLISNEGTDGYVIADAVRFVYNGAYVLDNDAASGVVVNGTWTASTNGSGYEGANYLHDGNSGKGSKWVRFSPDISLTQSYSVHIKWTANANRATNVPVTVTHAGGTANFTVNQQANGGAWVHLGTYTFDAGTSGNIQISNAGTNGYVIVDAVCVAPLLNLTGYELTFSDEFNAGQVLDAVGYADWQSKPPAKWFAHTPYSTAGFGDAWFGFAAPNNPFSITAEGHLSIKAWYATSISHWVSGLLASVNPDGAGFKQRYGYFEARMKFPAGTGTWPAFWLMSDGRWQSPQAKSAEIDVVEFYGNNLTRNQMAVHLWNIDGSGDSSVGALTGGYTQGMTTGLHTYGVLVEPHMITWYVDGIQQWQRPSFPEARDPLYLMVDYALGGGWPLTGVGDPSFTHVDYVRAYGR